MNMICSERHLLWTWSVMNGSVMNVICYERVCYEQVCYERGLLWTDLFWTDTSRDYFAVAMKSSGDSRQKIEEHVVTDLDLCKNEKRPSSTSSTVAEERQDASSKNTIDEMADGITWGNDIGLWALWSANIPAKCGNIGWNMKQVLSDIAMKRHFWNVMLHNTEKTETCHRNVTQVLFVARTTMAKWLTEACFVFFLHKLVLNVSLVDWWEPIRLNVSISLLEKESSTGSTLLIAWGASSIQWNM